MCGTAFLILLVLPFYLFLTNLSDMLIWSVVVIVINYLKQLLMPFMLMLLFGSWILKPRLLLYMHFILEKIEK